MLATRLVSGATFAALVLTVGAVACSEDDVMVPADERRPACMLLIGTEGFWEDGTSQLIYDVFETGHVAAGCMCLTEEEFDSKSRRDDLAELVLAECERLSALFEFDRDDCRADYERGAWLPVVYWADDSDFDYLLSSDFSCH